MKCADCRYANKSGNEEYVFCTYWQNKCNEAKMEETSFVKKVIFEKTLLDKVALGRGYPSQHYKFLWNNQICIEKNQCCQNYQEV